MSVFKTVLTCCATVLPLLHTSLPWADDNEGAQVKNAYRGVMQDRSAATEAEALYVEKCSMCHRRMGMGTVLLARRLGPDQAMLENRQDLNRALIEITVRQGLGNMPRISRAEVSDEQLDTIIAWLTRHDNKGN